MTDKSLMEDYLPGNIFVWDIVFINFTEPG